jgi:hypothetical protein
MDRRTPDQQTPQAESGSSEGEAQKAGFIPLPMRQPRLRGGNPPPEPSPESGEDEASAPLE